MRRQPGDRQSEMWLTGKWQGCAPCMAIGQEVQEESRASEAKSDSQGRAKSGGSMWLLTVKLTEGSLR